MQKDALMAVAAGLLSAVLFLSAAWSIIGAFVLMLLAPLPLLAAGLAYGRAAALIAGAIAALTVGGIGNAALGISFSFAWALPPVFISHLALLNRQDAEGGTEWYPPGHLLAWITLYAGGALAAIGLLGGSGPDGMLGGFTNTFIEAMRQMMPAEEDNRSQVDSFLAAIKLVFPAMTAFWWIVVTLVNTLLAQKLATRLGRNQRPAPDLRWTALPPWFAGVTVAATALGLLGSGWLGYLGDNIALILWAAYVLVGLAILHKISEAWAGRTAILIALYLVLLVFSWIAVVIAAIGLFDHWTGLRQRFGGPSRSQERNE